MFEELLNGVGSKPDDPHWTDLDYPPPQRFRDALGIETLSETILDDLLPGINNQTQRARYYSFWAWVVRSFIRDPQTQHTQAAFYEWLRPREAMLILAHFAHQHSSGSGLAGRNQGSVTWNNGTPDSYPLQWKSLISVQGGAYQQYYRGPLSDMHIINDQAKPHDQLCSPIGDSLAEAYATAVANTSYVQEYQQATKVTKSIIEDFASAGCLCRLSQSPAERQALIDAFFRFEVNDARVIRRLESLCYFLDVLDQARGVAVDTDPIRAILYFWSYGTSHSYTPRGNFLASAQRWRIFQLRQYYVFAIESIWAVFLAKIKDQSLRPAAYLDWLWSTLDLSVIGQSLGIRWPTADPTQLTMDAFQAAIEHACPPDAFAPGPQARSTLLNEDHLFHAIQAAEQLDVNTRVGAALLMLGLIYRRSGAWQGEAGWQYASDSRSDDTLSIEGYRRHMAQAITEQWSLRRWLSWFHERYLWLRHRHATIQKMVNRREDPSFFTWEAGVFYGLEDDKPKMNAPRFPNALQIMVDLELIQFTQRGTLKSYQLTPAGHVILQRFSTYSIPSLREQVIDETATDAA